MELGMIGLGRMGTNMVRRLLRAHQHSVAYDLQPDAVRALVKEGAVGANSTADFVRQLSKPRVDRMMVPAAAVDSTLQSLIPCLERDDVITDGGNSYCHDDIRRSAKKKEMGIQYVDVGTSGIRGAERGYALEAAIESAWVVVDPVLTNHHRCLPHDRGSWGPKEADDFIARDAYWHIPQPEKTSCR